MVWLQDLYREERMRTQVDSDCTTLQGNVKKQKAMSFFQFPASLNIKIYLFPESDSGKFQDGARCAQQPSKLGSFCLCSEAKNFRLKLFSTHMKSFKADLNLCPRAEPCPLLSFFILQEMCPKAGTYAEVLKIGPQCMFLLCLLLLVQDGKENVYLSLLTLSEFCNHELRVWLFICVWLSPVLFLCWSIP